MIPQNLTHDSWKRYHIETLSMLLALCEWNPLETNGFPSQRTSDSGFDIFYVSKQTVHLSMIGYAVMLIWCHCNGNCLVPNHYLNQCWIILN